MAEVNLSLDTYALVEIYLGNERFLNYLDKEFVINDITLAEFYGVLLKDYGEEEAEIWLKKLESYSHRITRETLIEAIKFRQKHKKLNLSFVDAVGYIFSVQNGCYFVTGDKEFENLPNVEFKKK